MVLYAVEIGVENVVGLRELERGESVPVLGDRGVLAHTRVVRLDPGEMVSLVMVYDKLVEERELVR